MQFSYFEVEKFFNITSEQASMEATSKKNYIKLAHCRWEISHLYEWKLLILYLFHTNLSTYFSSVVFKIDPCTQWAHANYHAHLLLHMCACTFADAIYAHSRTHTCVLIHTCTQSWICTHTRICTHTHICILTSELKPFHIQLHIHSCTLELC